MRHGNKRVNQVARFPCLKLGFFYPIDLSARRSPPRQSRDADSHKLYTGVAGERVDPRLRESRLLAPSGRRGTSSRNLGPALSPNSVIIAMSVGGEEVQDPHLFPQILLRPIEVDGWGSGDGLMKKKIMFPNSALVHSSEVRPNSTRNPTCVSYSCILHP